MLLKNIFITGFMGTGKSTVGRYLAKKMGMPFLDTDSLIEYQQNLSVQEIFNTYGENYFRNLENKLLKEFCGKKNIIVSTGGGTLLSEENYQLASNYGIVFLLWARPEIILKRLVKEEEKRPLLSGENKLEKISLLLAQRNERYNRFKNQIDTSDLTIEQVAGIIIDFCERVIDL